MICAFCNAQIDDDSFFCDQCGEEILVCELCGEPGKKKRCTKDGQLLVPAKSRNTVKTDQPAVAADSPTQPMPATHPDPSPR